MAPLAIVTLTVAYNDVGANEIFWCLGAIAIGTIDDSANGVIGDSAICENFANGTIANGVINAIAIGANGDSTNSLLAPTSLCVTIANGAI